MLTLTEYITTARATFPTASIQNSRSGACIWIDIELMNRFFTIQVTPENGIGVSELNSLSDEFFSGHDEVFQNFKLALDFIEEKIASRFEVTQQTKTTNPDT
jgi:hypothetical protein